MRNNNFYRSKVELERWAEKRAGNRSRHSFAGGGKRATGGARVSERLVKVHAKYSPVHPSCVELSVAFLKFTQILFPKHQDEHRCRERVPHPDQLSERKNSIYGTLTRIRSKRSQQDLHRLGREISPVVRRIECCSNCFHLGGVAC